MLERGPVKIVIETEKKKMIFFIQLLWSYDKGIESLPQIQFL